MKEDLEKLALALLKTGAVKFGAFRSTAHERNPDLPLLPIYINLRIIRSEPGVMDLTVSAYEDMIFDKKLDLKNDLLGDTPVAATPIVSILMHKTGIPMITPREEKTHGILAKIEGKFKPGQKVLIIDDVITWGDTKFKRIKTFQDNGLIVKDILVLVDQEKGGTEVLEKAGYRLYAVFKIRDLLSIYLRHGKIDQKKYDETIARIKTNT